jgi:hypothetical protein
MFTARNGLSPYIKDTFRPSRVRVGSSVDCLVVKESEIKEFLGTDVCCVYRKLRQKQS